VIRRTEAGLWQARCDGALDCNARSKPGPRNWAASAAKRAGWSVIPGLFPDGTQANMGVTICPRCCERLAKDEPIDTGSDDRPPPPKAKTLAPKDIMPDLIRKIRDTMREQR